MIKFSWKKINDKLGWKAISVLEYFYLKQIIPLPKFMSREPYKIVKMAAMQVYPIGSCFILNINEVLKKTNSPNDLYMYLELASKRNVFDYNIRGILHLPIILVEEYKLEWVERNPLLTIENDNIYFKYEQEKQ